VLRGAACRSGVTARRRRWSTARVSRATAKVARGSPRGGKSLLFSPGVLQSRGRAVPRAGRCLEPHLGVCTHRCSGYVLEGNSCGFYAGLRGFNL